MKFRNVARRFYAPVLMGAALASTAPLALASEGPTIDVSEVTSFISGSVTAAVAGIGVAVLLLVYAIKGYKWVRRAG